MCNMDTVHMACIIAHEKGRVSQYPENLNPAAVRSKVSNAPGNSATSLHHTAFSKAHHTRYLE